MQLVEVKLTMTDICMCNNKQCAISQWCFRYRATPSQHQAYFIVDKVVDNSDDCSEFWEVTNDDELAKLNRYWRD